MGSYDMVELIGPILLFAFGGIVAVTIMSLVSRDGSPDPRGDRPRSIYLHSVMFVALLVGIWALVGVARGVVTAIFGAELADDAASFPGGEDFIARQTIGALVLMVAVFLVFRVHRRLAHGYSREPGFVGSPGGRVAQTYFYLACFAASVTGIASAVSAANYAMAAIWPHTAVGVLGRSGGIDAAIGHAVVGTALALLMWALFRAYWAAAERGRAAPAGGPGPVDADAGAPPADPSLAED